MKIEVKIYQDQDGQRPFKKWLSKLDWKSRDRIEQRLTRIEQGNLGDCKNLGNEIYELRFFFNSGYRVYFGKKEYYVIILCGGDKNSQNKDIEKAKQYWSTYNE